MKSFTCWNRVCSIAALPGQQRHSPLAHAISVLLVASATLPAGRGADGTWVQLAGGDATGVWSDPLAWADGVVADGAGATANFASLDITAPSAITLDTPRTIGNLVFGDIDPTTPANWTLDNNFDPANTLTLSGPSPAVIANGGAGSTLTVSAIFAGTDGVTFDGNSTILSSGAVGHTYTGGTILKGRVETTNVANAPLTIFGAAIATNTVTFDGGYFRIFNTTTSTSAGGLINDLIVNTTGTLEYSGRSYTTGALTGNGVLNVITHYVRSDNGGNWSGFTGTINVSSGDAGVSDFRQTTYNGFANATLNLETNANVYFTPNQAASGTTAVSIGALSGVASAVLSGGPVAGRVTSFQIGSKNLDSTFAGAIEANPAVNRFSNVVKNGIGTLALTGGNSAYTGPTTVNAGTLAVAVLANGGAVSSIGRSANGPGNLVINGGVLRYIGGGSSTDRLLTLGADSPTIEASGTGAVQFTNTGELLLSGFDTSRTLTFGGTSPAQNVFAPVIPDNGLGPTTLMKTGAGTWSLTAANTYTGATTISGGVLSVAVLGNGGVASGIGQSSSAASNLVLDGGALRYIGPAASTDRALRIGAAGAALEASGTGPGVFDNPAGIELAGADLARAVTLGGTNPGPNMLAAVIADGGAGATSLVKSGAGTWRLTGANTFSGGTTIHAGRLTASNVSGSATGSGPVIVNNSGALGGAGVISGPVTVNEGGRIVPGEGVGTITVAGLTLSTGSVLDYELNATPANDRIIVSMPDGLTINGGGFNLFAAGTLNKWTTPGTYELVQFTGAIGGTGTGALSVLNPQNGLNYAFNVGDGLLRLVISATSTLSEWTAIGSGSWNNAANWSNGIPNAQNDAANFLTALTAPGTITLDGDKRVGTIQFNNANAYTLAQGTGGTLTLETGGGSAQIIVLNGDHAINAPVALASDTTIDVNNGADALSLSGSIGGGGTLTKAGAGVLALTGTNTFQNGTVIRAGTVQIGTNTSLGSGTLVFDGTGTLRAGVDGLAPPNPISIGDAMTAIIDTVANALDLGGVISNTTGSGALRKTGTGTLTLGNANTYRGATTISGGILSVSMLADGGLVSSLGQSGSDSANLVIDGGTLRYTGEGATTDRLFTVGPAGATIESAGSGAVSFTNPAAIALSGTDLPRTFTLSGTNPGANTFGAIIGDNGSGATSLIKAGVGTWVLSAANTFRGPTEISRGTLVLGHALALQNSTLNYDNQGGALSFDVLGSATLGALAGAQDLVLENAFAGPVALSVGASNTDSVYAGVLNGSGSLVKIGSGILSLTGQSTYTGATTIAAGGGVLKALVTDALSPGTFITVNNPLGLHLGDGVTLSSSVTAASGANEFLDVPDAGAVATFAGNAGVAGGGNQFRLGISGPGATLNITGALNIPNAGSITILTRGNLVFAGTAQFNAAPGVLIGRSNQALDLVFKDDAVANLGVGTNFGGGQPNPSITLTIQDNAVFNVGSLDVNSSSAAGNQTVINLNGGVLASGSFFKTSIGDSQLSTLNLNGGILRASTTNEVFLPEFVGLTANVQAGGARIDTNGFDITVAQPLLHDGTLAEPDGGVRKLGDGALTLVGDSTYTGPTALDAGRLVVSGSLSGTSRVAVAGAVLELAAADRFNDSAAMTINAGGTFNSRGFSETLGTFTLGGDAIIDLGAGASVLAFSESASAPWSPGTLTIAGWTGSTAGGGADQIFFGNNASGLSGAQVAQVRFADPAGFEPGFYGAAMLETGELVAVIPEPGSASLLLAIAGGVLSLRRRRVA